MATMPNGDISLPRRGLLYPDNPNEAIYERHPKDTYYFILLTPEQIKNKKPQNGLKELDKTETEMFN